MQNHSYCLFFLAAICLFSCPMACQSPVQNQVTITTSKPAPRDRLVYDSLHLLLADHYTDMSESARNTLRETLKKQTIWSFDVLCSETEPGTHITLKGRLVDEQGQPVPGAHLHIFHTDSRGHYSPLDSITGHMLESDPRLEGFLFTDSLGRFEIRTVHPGSYPGKYKGRTIPQHVHINVEAKGFKDGQFQAIFEDDPAMADEHWKKWAQEGGNPVFKFVKGTKEIIGETIIRLERSR